jgi:endonuclease/exonuclease/phosphatase family metal-dependent hydrolase
MFTGVYFPPTTLGIGNLAQLLDRLRYSTVIIGDINTRFQDPKYQARAPGPPEHLLIFNQFLSTTKHRHLKPERLSLKLTTDHCFVRSGQTITLQLLDNTILKMDTDHKYTLGLTVRTGGESPIVGGILRFRVR